MPKANKPKRSRIKDPNVYPPGWNRNRVEEGIKYYDRLKDEPLPGSWEIAKMGKIVWMDIPQDLVPEVLQLIEKRKKSA